jgi:hypothetical protein
MAVGNLAERQHGLITHDQARQEGFSMRQITARIESGQWVRVVRGVYRVAGAPVTWQQTALAACLAGPPTTTASHVTAAALRGLGPPAILPHVTVPRSASARLPLARVHRADLEPDDHDCLFGVPCTSVPRTLLDCAAMLGDRALASMVDDALCRRLTTVKALVPPENAQGIRGAARLRRVLEAWAGGIEPGSPAEVRLQRQLVAWGFPKPVRQHPVHDSHGVLLGKLDLAWPTRLIGVEYDSDRWHNPRRWSHDENRHAAVVRMGWVLLHADKADVRAGERRFRNELERAWRARPQEECA